MSPVTTETLMPGWRLGPTPEHTVIYTGKLHHERGRYHHLGKVHEGEHSELSLLADQEAAEAAYFPLIWHSENVHLRNLADHAPINYVSALRGVRTGP